MSIMLDTNEENLKRREFLANLQFKILEMECLRFLVEEKIDKETMNSRSTDTGKKADVYIGRIKKSIDEAKKLISLYSKELSYEDFFARNRKRILLIDFQYDILKAEIWRNLLTLVSDYLIEEKGKPISEFETNLENIENRLTFFVNYKKAYLENLKEGE